MKKRLSLLLLTLIISLSLILTGCGLFTFTPSDDPGGDDTPITSVPENVVIGGEQIPAYTTEPYYVVNGNTPFFTASEITSVGFYNYTDLDELGRCGVASACIGPETLPTDEREDINHIHPSGWYYNGKSNNNRYDKSTGVNGYIFNRAHLLANQLVSEDVDERNLITGTSAMNQRHMVTFENMVADYVKETDGHVMYRVTPYFEGNNLICSGVLMEGYSVEDEGESVLFCVFIYNVQPGIYINYLTGENCLASEMTGGDTNADGGHEHSTTADGDRAATCTEKAYCSVCGKEYGNLASHTPNADDGDCTTAVTCSVCGDVTTAAASAHTGGSATCKVKAKCSACGKEYGSLASHTPNADDGDPTTAVTCSVCGDVTTPGASGGDSSGSSSVQVPENVTIGGVKIPAYTSSGYYVVNNNTPFFTQNEITTTAFYTFSELDSLGRAGVAFGCIGVETIPTDAREDISHIHPSGWYYNGVSNNNSYPGVSGLSGTVYNRAHLFANMLVSEDVDERNFVTGTEDFNQTHMLSFENLVQDYAKESGQHVMYRVTPYFEGNNLICSGVLMEGYSVEDEGASVEFCVFIYNVQPGIYINYLTGENSLATEDGADSGEVYTKVSNPAAGVAYKLVGTYSTGDKYFNGGVSSSGLSHTSDISGAVDVYLESTGTNGEYYLYFYSGTTKYYIVMTGTGTSNFKASTTKDSYWIMNSNGALVSNIDTGNSNGNRALAVNNSSANYFRAYYESEVTSGKYTALFFALAN
ncbi:MAG: DNA/RNA non-specific endonuclease [Clostridia bacterium]|nr:DNA/RNA non-specific endonuclease [Clostridia bacterium]